MKEYEFYNYLLIFMFTTGIFVFFLLFKIPAPYGKHKRPGWGPEIREKTGWYIMEIPALLFFILIYFLGSNRFKALPLFFLFLWIYHYFYRSILYSSKLDSTGKTIPVSVVVMGVSFNLINTYLQARYISNFGTYSMDWIYHIPFIAGTIIFISGSIILRMSDKAFISLKHSNKGYVIPQGGFFRWVSCPNYFGEIVQWTGWAIATWSLAGALFAFWTFANLAPRAIAHHRWYKSKFSNYPEGRKALIPYLI